MIQFPKGINPTGRERYLTDANKPSCIQREKSPGRHSRDRALPVLKVILVFALVLLCSRISI